MERYSVRFTNGEIMSMSVAIDDQRPLAIIAAVLWASRHNAQRDYAPSVASFRPTNSVARNVMPDPIR